MLINGFQHVSLPVVVCLSGGLDSSTLLAQCVDAYGHGDVMAVSFKYGQRHMRELTAAMAIASMQKVRHKIIELPLGVFQGSSQTNLEIDVPHGHYEDESMRSTVVPNRNSIFLNYAAAWAIGNSASTVAYAAHAGDHAVYPDCRPAFVEALARLFDHIDYRAIDLFAPYINMTKKQIAEQARAFPRLIELSYSCYEGKPTHCGKCGTCVERREALSDFDPTEYRA